MDLKHIILVLVKVKIIQCAVYYSNNDVRTYRESVLYCQSIGGRLLRYGELFNQVIRTCGKDTGLVQAWTGTPWYKFEYCVDSIGSRTTTSDNRQENKHVGFCADFCENENYNSFAVQTTECTCYDDTSKLTTVDCSAKTSCPGNTFDRCGTGTSVYLVYKKTFNSTNSCVGRTYQNSGNSGQEFVLSSPARDLCSDSAYKLNYLCQVGQDDIIVCNLEQLSSPTSENILPTESASKQSSTGLTIGLAVSGVLLLWVILTVVVCWRIRTRSATSKEKMQKNTECSQKTDVHRYDSVLSKNMIEDRNDKNTVQFNNGYDSATRNPVISDNSEYNYHQTKPDGVYDSANQSRELTLTSANKNASDSSNVNYGFSMTSDDVYHVTFQNENLNEIERQRIYDKDNYGCTVKPEGVYDHAHQTTVNPGGVYDHALHPKQNLDNIYDHQINENNF